MSCALLTKEKYAEEETWEEFFNNGGHISDIKFHHTWWIMFSNVLNGKNTKKRIDETNNALKKLIKKNKKLQIYPLPRFLFSAFMNTRADELKVVFIGQDPYPGSEKYNGVVVPQATGSAFSIAHGMKITSSLKSVFNVMKKFGHIDEEPESGNLWFLSAQGCLFLNTILTVEDDNIGCHAHLWEWFTDDIIQYISDYFSDIIFVAWGAYAYKKSEKIDADKHDLIVSSHPSGRSANTPFREFPAFNNQDHFGIINKKLIEKGKEPIIWKL